MVIPGLQRMPPGQRPLLLVGAGGIIAIFALALWLHPDPSGIGTHEQFGLPPCGTMRLFGFPCPFCGMTTAFAHMVRGEWGEGFQAQPAGAAMFIAFAGMLVYLLLAGITGWWWIPRRHERMLAWSWRAILVGLIFAWVYKIVLVRLHT